MKLAQKNIIEILETEGLPRRLIVAFAAACAKDALSKVSKPDPRAVLAVEVATRYGDGEDFTETYLREVINDAAVVYTAPAAITYVADAGRSGAAFYAITCAHSAVRGSPFFASSAAIRAAFHSAIRANNYIGLHSNHYKPLLINMIRTRLTKVEIALILDEYECSDPTTIICPSHAGFWSSARSFVVSLFRGKSL